MRKNGIPGVDYPPGKKTSAPKDTADKDPAIPKGLSGIAKRAGFDPEEDIVTASSQAEQAAKARDAIQKSPAGTEGPSIGEEQARVRAEMKGERDAGRKERTRGAGGTKRGVRGGKESRLNVEQEAPATSETVTPEVPHVLDSQNERVSAEIEIEYYRLRDTNSLKSGVDGFVISLEEFAAQKREESSAVAASTEAAPDSAPEPLPADATPLERQRRLRSDIVNDAVTKMEAQSVKAEVAKKTYFDALKAYQHKRGFAGIAAESFVGDTLLTPKALKDLRHTWVYERALSAATQRAATEVRLKEKPATREAMLQRLKTKHEAKGTYNPEKHDIQKRYERMVTLKSVVTGQEEEEIAVRTEGFSTRDKKTLELMFERYKKVPPALRIFGTSAALLGGTVMLAGSPVGLAALGMVGASAGLRYWAEKAKSPEMKKWLSRVAPIASIAGAAGALLDYGVQFGHKVAGTEKKAKEFLAKKEGLGDLDSVENLEHISKERRKALVAKENIARHGRIARVLTSVGLGFFLGHQASGGTHETVSGVTTDHSPSSPELKVEYGAPGHEVTAPSEGVQVTEAATSHIEPYSVDIDPGQGMDKLFVELRDHYKEIYPNPDASNVPPGIRHILNANSGDELSREFGFINDSNASYVMKDGDSLGFDAQGNLVFTPAASGAQSIELLKEGVPHHLTAAEKQGHFIRHAEASMAGTHPSPEAHVTSATTVPSGEDPSAMLNRLQTVHPSELAGHEEVFRAEPGSLGAEDIHSYEAPTISDSTLDTYTPEQPPAAPVAESQPSEPAPAVEKPEPAPVAPETPSAPAQAPESVTAHAFAEPGAPQAINPHGVDLNKPQLLVNNGLKFAHGVDTGDSYSRAFAESQRLFGEGAKDTNVYFVARDYDALGNPYLAVRMVFTPPDGSTPQMAPYGEGVSLSPEFTMPPLPKDADYKPLS